ncbi:MAG: UDP-N-acetylmuramoyl-L-alanine--D-glutamate ligase [Candidatus Saccharimonadales bacterium]
MKVAIVGFGIEGKVSAAYWSRLGADVTICDQKTDVILPENTHSQLGVDYLRDLKRFDVIVRTAGLHPNEILMANSEDPSIARRITTSLNEFIRVCPTQHVIGITGTKGKGTTSTLVTKILLAAGFKAHLGGNIGIAPLEMLLNIQPQDWVVLEMSSFQLIDFTGHVPLAACLMIAPEHLNWHADLKEYYAAKSQLFIHQLKSDQAIYNANSVQSQSIVALSPALTKTAYEVPDEDAVPTLKQGSYVSGETIYYQNEKIMSTRDVKLLGRHNLENVCAAITIVWPIISGNVEAIRQVVSSFSGLPHHTEFVTNINDVSYYNDSYSTMPEATIAALKAIPGQKVLILGGGSKNLPLDDMISAIAAAPIRHVVLIGSLAQDLAQKLTAVGVTNYSFSMNGMADIVAEAQKYAHPGDIVLLSPGLPAKGDGFFIDNVDRGNQFKACLGQDVTSTH